MDNKNNTNGQGDPNHIYFQELKKLQKEREEWLKKEGVKSEQEWYERRQLNNLSRNQ